MTDELAFHDATALVGLIRSREITAAELLEATIARIERLNPRLNAVVTPMYDEARRAVGRSAGAPFAGVPFLLKDLNALYGGVPLRAASALLDGFVPGYDSELVTRLKRAGLVVVGKTNLSEFGILPTTEPALHGPTRNPWDLSRTPGGSSGGSAAAVAAGLVPFAHGNDGGGSIRVPAACCGLFGLKPTRARNPHGPDHGDVMSGLMVEHVITRSVRDSAAVLDVTAGPDVGDPYWAPPAARPFVREVGAPPGTLRIAFTTATANGVTVHPDCVAAVHDAARLAADLGHDVAEAHPKIEGEMMTRAFVVLWAAGCAWTIDGLAELTGRRPTPETLEPFTWALYEMGTQTGASAYLRALQAQQRLAREIGRFFVEYDVWLTPTLGEPPPPLGEFAASADDPLAALARAGRFVPYTPLCNMTGQPAMSVPLAWSAAGLPIGTHWMGRFGDEATLFRLAAQLEAARPWAHRRPPAIA